MLIQFETYDKVFLDCSIRWLDDPEIKRLTMAPPIDHIQQEIWFQSLDERKDYFIRGIMADGIPIGAMGIKHIDFIKEEGEYWGYIGEKEFIGRGIGNLLLTNAFDEARRMGLKRLLLHVADYNKRAYNLYLKHEFMEMVRENGIITMEKIL